MAIKYKDFSFNLGNYNKMEEYTDAPVFVLAVRNILLSKPGNYPFTPGLGIDIEQYMFDLADENTKSRIESLMTEKLQTGFSYLINVNPHKRDFNNEFKTIIKFNSQKLNAQKPIMTTFFILNCEIDVNYKFPSFLNLYVCKNLCVIIW